MRRAVAAAVLAAGSGERMGAPKAQILLSGARLIDRAVGAAREAGCAPVYAVVRPGTEVAGAEVIVNPEPARGMRSSLALAVAAAEGADALAVLLVDTPGVTAESVRSVAQAWRTGRIAVGRYRDGRGHPVVMAPGLWRAALHLAAPDEGARAFLARHPELVDEVAAAGDSGDLDTPDELARWLGTSGTEVS